MQSGRSAFLIGGTGQVGTAVARRLTGEGWSVLVAHRGETAGDPELAERDVTVLRMDREDTDVLLETARGHDLVLDTVAYSAAHGRQLARLAGEVGSVVVLSTASVYSDERGRSLDTSTDADDFPDFPVPISEQQPTVQPDDLGGYSAQKVALERTLLETDDLPVSILRPGAIHGPFSTAPREWFFIKRVRDGRRRVVLGYDGGSRFATTATVNLAELVLLCAENPGVRVLNAVDTDALSVAEIGSAIASMMHHHLEIVRLAGPPRNALGGNPWGVPKPMVLSMAAAEQELGYRQPVDYPTSVHSDIEWIEDVVNAAERAEHSWRDLFPDLAERYGANDWFDYEAEDAYLAASE